jgi:hypothetical protein
MAVRSPLYYTDSGNLKEFNLVELNDIYAAAKKSFLQSPAVQLTVQGSGGNLGNLSETHVIASAVTNNSRRFSNNNGSLGNISTTTVNYSRIEQTVTNPTPGQGANPFDLTFLKNQLGSNWPVYHRFSNPGGGHRAGGDSQDSSEFIPFTDQDFLDTFAKPVLQQVAGQNMTTFEPLYIIHDALTIGNPRYSIVSNTPVYTDNTANIAAFNAGNLPEARTQNVVVNNYYLYKLNTNRLGQQFVFDSSGQASPTGYRDSAYNRTVAGTGFKLNVEKIAGSQYATSVNTAGSGYVVSDNFIVTGEKLGGKSPQNDCAVYVDAIDSFGGVTSLLANPTKMGIGNQYRQPLTHTANGDLQTMTKTNFETLVNYAMKALAFNTQGFQVRFQYNSGTQCGSSMLDTRLTGASQVRRDQQLQDNYRSQRVPTGGTATHVKTHYLGVKIT